MKNVFVLLVMVMSFQLSRGQWTTNGNHIYNTNSGNVGIGVTSPGSPLSVYNASSTQSTFYGYSPMGGAVSFNGAIAIGQALTYQGVTGWFSRTNNGSATVALKLGQNRNWDYPTIELSTYDDGTSNYSSWYGTRNAHYMDFSRASSAGTKNIFEIGGSDGEQYVSVFSVDGTTSKIKFSADNTSYVQNNLGIGTTNTQGYKLAVNGDAIFTKIKVKTYGTWPDYVFHRSYNLRPLKDLETYIKQNNHLPDVPSANEVEKNGLDLGDNQAALLKKIEELTLYIIEQDKKIDLQQMQIRELDEKNQEIQDIKKQLEIIKAKLQTN